MRKAGAKNTTPETIEKVWKLHNRNVPTTIIAETLGLSIASATRIVTIMKTARDGGDVDSLYQGNQAKVKAFAKDFFGIIEEAVETPPQAEKNDLPDDFKEFAVRVLFELHHTNKLLEKLCEELGVGNEQREAD